MFVFVSNHPDVFTFQLAVKQISGTHRTRPCVEWTVKRTEKEKESGRQGE